MVPEEVEARILPYWEESRVRFGVEVLYLFGSSARGEAGEGSDVDLLVRFSRPPGFLDYMGLKVFLEDLLRRSVDVDTERERWTKRFPGPCGSASPKEGVFWLFFVKLGEAQTSPKPLSHRRARLAYGTF